MRQLGGPAPPPQVVLRAEQAGGLPRLSDLLVEPSWRAALEGETSKAYWADLVRGGRRAA